MEFLFSYCIFPHSFPEDDVDLGGKFDTKQQIALFHALGEVSRWNLTRCKLFQDDDSGDVNESWKEKFGVY